MADNVKNSFIVVLPNQIITIPQDSNLAWLPLFYALPKELVSKRKQYLEIPRSPYDVLRTDKYDNLIKDDAFLEVIPIFKYQYRNGVKINPLLLEPLTKAAPNFSRNMITEQRTTHESKTKSSIPKFFFLRTHQKNISTEKHFGTLPRKLKPNGTRSSPEKLSLHFREKFQPSSMLNLFEIIAMSNSFQKECVANLPFTIKVTAIRTHILC